MPVRARQYLRGQRISTAVVESMVNRVIGRRMAKKQPMRWSRRGAHLLVQIRLAVLDGRLPQAFQRWYPRFEPAGPAGSPRPRTTPRFVPLSSGLRYVPRPARRAKPAGAVGAICFRFRLAQ